MPRTILGFAPSGDTIADDMMNGGGDVPADYEIMVGPVDRGDDPEPYLYGPQPRQHYAKKPTDPF